MWETEKDRERQTEIYIWREREMTEEKKREKAGDGGESVLYVGCPVYYRVDIF